MREKRKAKLIYFDDEDWEAVVKKSKEANLSTTRYIRSTSVNGIIIYKDIGNFKDVIYEINKIGVNINQIAEVINTYKKDFEHTKRLEEIIKEFQYINNYIKEKI